jgi:hypothetical protein
LSAGVGFDFFGAPFVIIGWEDGFKSVVSGNAIFLNSSLIWSFVTSSALKNLACIASHSVRMEIFDLSFSRHPQN